MNQPLVKKPRYIRTKVGLPKGVVYVYAGKHVTDALRIIDNHTLYEGVKLLQLLEVIYVQGRKDGARSVFEAVDVLKDRIPYRNPGAPRKHKKRMRRIAS